MNKLPISKFFSADSDYAPLDQKSAFCELHGDYTSYLFNELLGWTGCFECRKVEFQKQNAKERGEAVIEINKNTIEKNLNRSMLPERFSDRSFINYITTSEDQRQKKALLMDYSRDFAENYKQGRCIILCGNPGTGKTHLAISIAKNAIQRGYTAFFSTAGSMIANIHEKGFKKASEIDLYASPDLLVLDEVSGTLSQFDKDMLFAVLNMRYETRKPSILITNVAQNHLGTLLGIRLFDRLRENNGMILFCGWESYRK